MNVLPPVLAGRSVLIVEDQYLVAQAMCRSVEELQGHVLGPAPNVAAALAILDAETTHLALLDVNLGEEKIFPVLSELNRRRIPFIFTTGYESSALSPGHPAAPHLEKPVTTRALAEAVRKLL
jgi:DNA-binding NtrC family response regulator